MHFVHAFFVLKQEWYVFHLANVRNSSTGDRNHKEKASSSFFQVRTTPPPPSGSEVTILAHTAAPECAMKPSLYKCVNCIQNTFNDSSLVLVMAYDSPSRFNGGGGSRHKKNYSGTPLNGHPSKADTHDITDNSESPDLSFHSLQYLSNH